MNYGLLTVVLLLALVLIQFFKARKECEKCNKILNQVKKEQQEIESLTRTIREMEVALQCAQQAGKKEDD